MGLSNPNVLGILVVAVIVLLYRIDPTYAYAATAIAFAIAMIVLSVTTCSKLGGTGGRGVHRAPLMDEDAAASFNLARQGHRTESLVRHMMNRYANRGVFYEVRGEDPDLRLKWLYATDASAPDGRVYLDLDGYNEDLKTAFEYDGPLHRNPPRGSDNRGIRRWLVQRYNDRVKERLCRENGVRLFRIDERVLPRLDGYVKSRLRDVGGYTGPVGDYIHPLPSQPTKYSDYIARIESVERFGDGAPVLMPPPY